MRPLVLALAFTACSTQTELFVSDDGAMRGPDGSVLPSGDAGPIVPGDPSCGLAAPAFCDTFDAPSPGGRIGTL